MKIGFNKETLALAWDLVILFVVVDSALQSLGYRKIPEDTTFSFVYGISMMSLAGVSYLVTHSLLDKEEPIDSS